MTWGMVAVAGATVVGAVVSSNSASKAAKAQTNAANSANATQLAMYDQNREDTAPYRQAGYSALDKINELINSYKTTSPQDVLNDPGYQFGLSEGTKALQGSAAAGGGLYSGATLKALQRFGTDYATTKYDDVFNRQQTDLNNQFNRLSTTAGLGSANTAQTGANGMTTAGVIGGNLTGAANAQGAAGLTAANAWTNALNQSASAYRNYSSPSSSGYNYNAAYDPYNSSGAGFVGPQQ